MISWLTLADVKSAKGITDTARDTLLTALLPIAQEQVLKACPRFIPRQTFTEVQDGNGCAALVLKRRPVCGVVSIKDDPAREFGNDSIIDDADYAVDADAGVVYLDLELSDGVRNVQTVYVAGYGSFNPSDGNDSIAFATYDVPDDIIGLAANFVMFMANQAGAEGKASETIGEYSYRLADWTEFVGTSPLDQLTICRWADGSQAR